MKTKSVLRSCILALLVAASLGAFAQMRTSGKAGAQNAEGVVDAEGNLRVPADYRTAYQFLGSWAVAADQLVQPLVARRLLLGEHQRRLRLVHLCLVGADLGLLHPPR
jgi:hypothetical protein